MKISLSNVGKRFNREWIFRHLNYEFTSGVSYAITGPNGSGKSTLLQIIGNATTHSEGSITYTNNPALNHQITKSSNLQISPENIYKTVTIAAPYLELIEEMTLIEFLSFHASLKPFIPGMSDDKSQISNLKSQINYIISAIGLNAASHKQIRYYSSGMKQRVKLAQAIFSDVPLILLDEPCTNLDEEGISLYKLLINTYCKDRLVLVSSNDKNEYDFCQQVLDIRSVKETA